MVRDDQVRRARSSTEVMRRSFDEERSRQRRRSWRRRVFGLALIAFLVWGANVTLVGNPVKTSLAADARTAGIGLVGHFAYYVDPTTLVLDLRQPTPGDTAWLWTAALRTAPRLVLPNVVKQVLLERAGTPVYLMSGDDYRRLGRQLAEQRNPVLVLRDLPATLKLPDGTLAPAGDAAEAAQRWEAGAP